MQERAQAVYGGHDTHQGAIINDKEPCVRHDWQGTNPRLAPRHHLMGYALPGLWGDRGHCGVHNVFDVHRSFLAVAHVGHVLVSSLSSAYLTVNTGHGAKRTTFSATLPRSTWDSPVRPWVPMTMRSAPRSWATCTIVYTGGPAATSTPQVPWKEAGMRSRSCVRAASWWSWSTTIGWGGVEGPKRLSRAGSKSVRAPGPPAIK